MSTYVLNTHWNRPVRKWCDSMSPTVYAHQSSGTVFMSAVVVQNMRRHSLLRWYGDHSRMSCMWTAYSPRKLGAVGISTAYLPIFAPLERCLNVTASFRPGSKALRKFVSCSWILGPTLFSNSSNISGGILMKLKIAIFFNMFKIWRRT